MLHPLTLCDSWSLQSAISGYISSSRSLSPLPSYRCACLSLLHHNRDVRPVQAGPCTVVEVGCGMWISAYSCLAATTVPIIHTGAGNAIFPLLEQNCNPELRIHAFDYSSHAIKLVQVGLSIWDFYSSFSRSPKHNALYISPPCGTITASVWDLSSAAPPPGLAPRSADILVLVFVLSALHPSEWPRAVSNIAQVRVSAPLLVLITDTIYTSRA